MGSALERFWERQSNPEFWWLLGLLVIVVVLIGAKRVFQQIEQDRKERQDCESRDED